MSGAPDISETDKEHIDKLVKAKLETNSPIVREFSSILQAESEDGKEGYTSFINQYFGVLVGCSGYFTPPPLEKFMPPLGIEILGKCVCETLRITFSKKIRLRRDYFLFHSC